VRRILADNVFSQFEHPHALLPGFDDRPEVVSCILVFATRFRYGCTVEDVLTNIPGCRRSVREASRSRIVQGERRPATLVAQQRVVHPPSWWKNKVEYSNFDLKRGTIAELVQNRQNHVQKGCSLQYKATMIKENRERMSRYTILM